MNEWNQMETRCRSWIPRRPSPGLKARLFPKAEVQEAPGFPSPAVRWAWLAPVMGCFFVVAVLTGSRGGNLGYLAAGGATNWLTMVASNQSYAAYIVADFHSEQNALQKDPIEWTNPPRASSLEGSFRWGKTNSLIR